MSGSLFGMTGLGSNGLGLGGTAGAGSVSPSVLQQLMGGGAPGAAGGAVSPMMQPQTPYGMPAGGFPTGIRPQAAQAPAGPTGPPPPNVSGFLGSLAGSGADPQSQMAATLMSPFMAQLAQAGGVPMPTYDNGLSSLLATLGQGQNGLAAPGAQGINPLMMMLQQYLGGGGGGGAGSTASGSSGNAAVDAANAAAAASGELNGPGAGGIY